MNPAHFAFSISVIALINILVNCSYSKEICIWVPSIRKKISLLLILWLVPVFGATYLYYQKNLSPMRQYNAHEVTSGQVVGGLFTEVDGILNPNKKHMLKAVEQQKIIRYERNKSNDSKNAVYRQFAVIKVNPSKNTSDHIINHNSDRSDG